MAVMRAAVEKLSACSPRSTALVRSSALKIVASLMTAPLLAQILLQSSAMVQYDLVYILARLKIP